MHRRTWLHAAGATLATAAVAACAQKNRGDVPRASAEALVFERAMQRIEADSGGRMGVALHDTTSGQRHHWRAAERFPMCSTFKFVAAALVLQRVDQGLERLDRRIAYQASDLVPHSPATAPHAGGPGMEVGALCDATITLSDNAAANLLLQSFGGPAALTAYFRSLGDGESRLDRTEPTLNTAIPGDPRDTTTPAAMAHVLQRTVLGDALSAASRDQLTRWLLANQTGGTRLRARLPAGWRVADKTGAGANGTNNDVGLLYPPAGRAPWVVTAYLTDTAAADPVRDAALAEVGALVAALAG